MAELPERTGSPLFVRFSSSAGQYPNAAVCDIL